MTPLELEHLKLLLEMRSRAHTYAAAYDEKLEDFVLRMRVLGCSARGMAEALGVGSSTIHTWTKNARERQG